MTPWTELTTPQHFKNSVLLGWGVAPEVKHQRGQKVHLFMGMTPRLKTVPNVPLGFPEYGMTNASKFRWGIPPAICTWKHQQYPHGRFSHIWIRFVHLRPNVWQGTSFKCITCSGVVHKLQHVLLHAVR